MGYEQELTLEFLKLAGSEAEAKAFQERVMERLEKTLDPDTHEEAFDQGQASVSAFTCARHIYDWNAGGDALIGTEGVSAEELSRELGCRLKIEYHGEERGDDDRRVFDNGRLLHRWMTVEVDTEDGYIEAFSRLIDEVGRKGLAEEAEKLHDITMKMAARYLFSSSSA